MLSPSFNATERNQLVEIGVSPPDESKAVQMKSSSPSPESPSSSESVRVLTRTKTWLIPEGEGSGSITVPVSEILLVAVNRPLGGLVMDTTGAFVSAWPPVTICSRSFPTLFVLAAATAIL